MNYRHAYHAGNFADVFKHIVLVILIQALQRKETPICYLDTHAGIGRYDLYAEAAQKTHEFEDGIQKILKSSRQILPEPINIYLQIIQAMNQTDFRYYPGSPRVARALLRSQDRMILTEFHPEEAEQLKAEFFRDSQVAVHYQDGYQALKAFLPPKERRGLVLIDPPFENPEEFAHILNGMKEALKRWATGVYAIWYPIKDRKITNQFIQQLKQFTDKLLVSEFMLYPDDITTRLNGCGMAVINPPWQADEKIKEIFLWLQERLTF